MDTAFNGIHLPDPATASNYGVADLDIKHGRVYFEEAEDLTMNGYIILDRAGPEPVLTDPTR